MGDGEWGDGEIGRLGDREMGRSGDGEMGWWGGGVVGWWGGGVVGWWRSCGVRAMGVEGISSRSEGEGEQFNCAACAPRSLRTPCRRR